MTAVSRGLVSLLRNYLKTLNKKKTYAKSQRARRRTTDNTDYGG